MAKKKQSGKKKAQKKTVKKSSKKSAKKSTKKSAKKSLKASYPAPGQLQIRMYRQGLGDCFLLAFGREDNQLPFFMLVDCGVHRRQDNGNARLLQVMNDIHEWTQGHLDIVIGTHEHVDHLSGFVLKESPFLKEKNAGFSVENFWVGWTEIIGDDQADELRKKHGTARKIIEKALEKYEHLSNGDASLGLSLDDAKQRLEALAEFELGIENDVDIAQVEKRCDEIGKSKSHLLEDIKRDHINRQGTQGYAGVLPAASERTKPSTCELAINLLTLMSNKRRECEPGDVVEIPELNNVRAYILGPPRDDYLLKKDLPSKVRGQKTEDGHPLYHETYLTPASNLKGFAYSPGLEMAGDVPSYVSLPFGEFGINLKRLNLKEQGKKSKHPRKEKLKDFYRQNYLNDPQGDDESEEKTDATWRRIDGDWLSGADSVALNLDSDTNNTSLVFALEIGEPGKGDVLLFVGDAQVGNWISWKDLEFEIEGKTISAVDLLKRTQLYKVGHHGSHNATLKRYYHKNRKSESGTPFGLELMDDILALIPVSYRAVVKKWPVEWKMPHKPLYERLRQKARRRILRSDQRMEPLSADEAEDLRPTTNKFSAIPDSAANNTFKNWKWRQSDNEFTHKQQGEPSDPLYYELQISPS